MNKNIKLALISLLGFSSACSTVKNAPKTDKDAVETSETETREHPRIMVMYGVPNPETGRVTTPLQEKDLPVKNMEEPTLDPVAERPHPEED